MSEDYSIDTKKTFFETKDEIENEFRLWHVNEFRIGREKDGGAFVEWYPLASNSLRVLRSSDQTSAANDLRKLYLIIKALRLNELRGFAEYMREYYLQLPAPATSRDPYDVLGVLKDTPLEDVETLYKAKARRLHPDTAAGDGEAMKELNAAIERIRQDKKPAPAPA